MRPNNPALFDIWEEPEQEFPVKMQLVNYIGGFKTKTLAEKFAKTIAAARAQDKVPKKK